MLKKSAVAAALFFVTVSSNLYALGLGAIDMQSGLNQPLNAVIDLTSASGTDLSEIKISIASKEAHDRTGLSRNRILSDFKFSVEKDSRGDVFVRVTSTDTVREPFLEFLLELEWPNGRLLREYTVLVDPPVTMPATPVAPIAPVSRTAAPVAQAPVRQSRPATSRSTTTAPVRTARAPASSADSYGPVRRNETLWDIARRTRPGNDITVDQMMHALLRENPRAFVNNNINRLKAGVTLNIPDRATVTAITASEAMAESRRQTLEWQKGQAAPAQESEPVASPADAVVEPEVATDARLQLTAPEDEAVAGAATASAGDPQAAEGQTASDVGKQLTLATEEAEASKAETQELQSRVNDLENQIETMKRLLELKDNALAGMQDQVTTDDAQAEMPEIVEPEVLPESDVIEIDEQADAEVEEVIEPEVELAEIAEPDATDEPRGIVNKLMDNPVLAGLGVLVAMLLGGFLWASTRQKSNQGIFDDEMTLEKHMASSTAERHETQAPVVDFEEEVVPEEETTTIQGHDESDPITEADVYLAYGRIQQAQDVLQAALEKAPSDNNLRTKLLEVYHAGGNVSAFDREASDFHDTVTEDDPQWLRVATMGFALSPENELYRAAAVDGESMTNSDFDMDLSGMDEEVGGSTEDIKQELPDSIEFNLDDDEVDGTIEDDEDASEGLLTNADEIATKLDLARAYIDMGDPEGARSILDEVVGEGNDDQKREAEEIISQLG
jgi:pilus assembly protein FimV